MKSFYQQAMEYGYFTYSYMPTNTMYMGDLTENMNYTEGKDVYQCINGCYQKVDELVTTSSNDTVLIGYTKYGTYACADGDFEVTSCSVKSISLSTGAGNDYVRVADEINGYTRTYTGTGDDLVIVEGAMDIGTVCDDDSRSFVFTESGNDTVIIGGDQCGQIGCKNDIKGGQVYTGSGSDNVLVYGDVTHGGVIDLGSGSIIFANPELPTTGHSNLPEQYQPTYGRDGNVDTAYHVNVATVCGDLGGSACEWNAGHIVSDKAIDFVNVAGTVRGYSSIKTGANNDVISVKNMDDNATIDAGTGNDTLDLSNIGWGIGKNTVDMGQGNDVVNFKGKFHDCDSQIIGGEGFDVFNTSGYHHQSVDAGHLNGFEVVDLSASHSCDRLDITMSDVLHNGLDNMIILADSNDTVDLGDNGWQSNWLGKGNISGERYVDTTACGSKPTFWEKSDSSVSKVVNGDTHTFDVYHINNGTETATLYIESGACII